MSGKDMQVVKYLPDKLFGFVEDSDSQRVFFHLRVFSSEAAPPDDPPRCAVCPFAPSCLWWDARTPPPIPGEPVRVTLAESGDLEPGDAPPATQVVRLTTPVAHRGIVEVFDASRGFGFVKAEGGKSFHLHRSEILDGRLPIPTQQVMFYAGRREGRPRACHVKVCR